jgi:hypothetical protein
MKLLNSFRMISLVSSEPKWIRPIPLESYSKPTTREKNGNIFPVEVSERIEKEIKYRTFFENENDGIFLFY